MKILILFTGKLTNGGAATPAGLISAAIAHAFALFVAVSVGANISGGHVNPAVTFGAFVGGHITLFRSVLYWIAQLLGSVVACVLLKFATGGLVINKENYSHLCVCTDQFIPKVLLMKLLKNNAGNISIRTLDRSYPMERSCF